MATSDYHRRGCEKAIKQARNDNPNLSATTINASQSRTKHAQHSDEVGQRGCKCCVSTDATCVQRYTVCTATRTFPRSPLGFGMTRGVIVARPTDKWTRATDTANQFHMTDLSVWSSEGGQPPGAGSQANHFHGNETSFANK
ncbi:hypothetical protein BaRGS_00002896 [Batillaria attramentaria]|uniref:Uncharacterized protein n=1 Tax=Batillaria attramentaria TaxID=370345 RepID=A0ABD0M129_9CAEN